MPPLAFVGAKQSSSTGSRALFKSMSRVQLEAVLTLTSRGRQAQSQYSQQQVSVATTFVEGSQLQLEPPPDTLQTC